MALLCSCLEWAPRCGLRRACALSGCLSGSGPSAVEPGPKRWPGRPTGHRAGRAGRHWRREGGRSPTAARGGGEAEELFPAPGWASEKRFLVPGRGKPPDPPAAGGGGGQTGQRLVSDPLSQERPGLGRAAICLGCPDMRGDGEDSGLWLRPWPGRISDRKASLKASRRRRAAGPPGPSNGERVPIPNQLPALEATGFEWDTEVTSAVSIDLLEKMRGFDPG